MKFSDLAKQPGAEVVEAPKPKFADLAKHPDAEPVEPGFWETAGDMGKTGLAHAYNTASMGLAPDLEDSRQKAITGGTFSKNAPPPGALRTNLEEALVEGAERNPYSAAVGDIAGFVAGAGTAGIPKALGLVGKIGGGFVKQRLARAGVGGLFGGATSGLQTLASTHDPEKAWEATKAGAGMGAAAFAAPEITAPALAIKGAINDDPVESASEITNAVALGIPTAMAKAKTPGALLERPGRMARETLAKKLIKELLPQETAAVKSRNALGEEAVGTANKAAEEAVGTRNKAAESKVKDIFREHRRAKSSLSSAPNGAQTPSIPGQPDLQAQALGKLGAKVQDNFRYLRSKDDLGLKLGPEAEAGAKAILPDYEAQANAELGQFAEGKGAVLQRIVAELMADRGGQGGGSPKPPLPRNMGFDIGFGGLKPNPTAGFTPEPSPTPAVFTPEPLPTAESTAPKAAEGVNTRLLQMRQDQGIGSRLIGYGAKGFLGPLGGSTAFGAAKGLVRDPVLATSVTEPVGKALSKIGAVGDRYSKFLAGATGPLLQKKLEFLMRTDPEFRAQVEASNE